MSINEFDPGEPTAEATVNQQELEKAIVRARRALNSTETREQTQAATERKMLLAKLHAEIKAGRDILPATILAEAGTALTGSTGDIKAMLGRLDNAWKTITEKSDLQKHIVQQTQQSLTLVSAKLSAISGMMSDIQPVDQKEYQKRLNQITGQVQSTRDSLKADQPEVVQILATRAHRRCGDVARRGFRQRPQILARAAQQSKCIAGDAGRAVKDDRRSRDKSTGPSL